MSLRKATAMSTYVLSVQDVAGDPALDGGEIFILKGRFSTVIFTEVGDTFLARDTEGRVSVVGIGSDFSFTYLGQGYVKGNVTQQAQFIRIAMHDGTFKTVAIDVSDDGAPQLSGGAAGLTVKLLSKIGAKPIPLAPESFTGGTLVHTECGECMVEDLQPGMSVWTPGNGYVRLHKVLRSKVQGDDRGAPILFCADSIGNDEPMLVSPNHRLHFDDPRTGKEEVIAAKELVNRKRIVRLPMPVVEYYHLVLEDNSLLDTYGALTEYFLAEPASVKPAAPVKAPAKAHRPWISAVEILGAAAPVSFNYA
jgi:hypothetical protein